MAGTNSILKIHPKDRSSITFDMTGAQSVGTGGYVVDAAGIDFNEESRIKVTYSEGANIDGGEAISYHGPLVSLTFQVIVYGTTEADLIAKTNDLFLAVTNEAGGTLEYKPDDLGAGVRSTYYRYVQSSPPRPRERWDKGPRDSGLYRMAMDVELMTQPYAISDPDNPVSVLSATTVYNQDDGQSGHVTIPEASLKGSMGALTQLRIKNKVAGNPAAIKRLYYARRTQGILGNFAPVLEGGTPDDDSIIWWSTISDNSRRSNNYLKYAPPEEANGLWATRSYLLSSPDDHHGKAAVVVVVRSLAENIIDWDLKASIEVSDTMMETDTVNVTETGPWIICVVGELDIPPTPISVDEAYAPVIKLHLKRNSGDIDNPIHVDFIQLFYVDEYPQAVTVTDGFTSDYALLLENMEDDLCHVVNASTLAIDRIAEAFCELLQLRPATDNRIDFIWERRGLYEILDDDFESYEAWKWAAIDDADNVSDWEGIEVTQDTLYYVEGNSDIKHRFGGLSPTVLYTEGSWDLTAEGRFGDSDFIYVPFFVNNEGNPGSGHVLMRFWSVGAGQNWFEKYILLDWITNGRFWAKFKKSQCQQTGSPDWSTIWRIGFQAYMVGGVPRSWYFDDIRIVKADPDDATKGNDTGTIWDFVTDVWHVEEQASTDHYLGCLDSEAGVEKVALIHEQPPVNLKYLACVRLKRYNGDVGLVFRCKDGTPGSEDMAAFFIDTSNDKLELRKWAAGTASDIDEAIDQTGAIDTDCWLGIWITEDSRVRCYFGATRASVWNDESKDFLNSAKVFDVTDSVFASGGALDGGQVGLLSISTLGRFNGVLLYGIGDGHVPGDTIEVQAKAIFRTIYPFGE